MKKRILPSILAVALLLSIAVVPTFASAGTTVTGQYEAITIAVDVPATQTAKVNPYGMPVTLDDAAETTISGQQITSLPIYVVNKTTVPLYVGATVVTTTKGSFALSKTADISSLKTKTGYLYMQMAVAEDENGTPLGEDAMKMVLKTGNTEIDSYTLDKDVFYPVFAAWDQDFDSTKDLVLATGDAGVSKSGMMLLSAAEKVAATGTSGNAGYVPAHTAVTEGGIGMVRIAGSVVEEPTEKWTASDGFTAKITYSFKPDTTSVKLTADKAATDKDDTDGVTLTAKVSSGNIKAITWTLLDKTSGEEVTPTAVTWTPGTADDTSNTSTATLKVAAGALTQDLTVKVEVTADNDQTYTQTKDIAVTGDVTITQSTDDDNDAPGSYVEGTTVTIDNQDGDGEYYLKVAMTGATITSVAWSIEDEDGNNSVAAVGNSEDGLGKFTCAADKGGTNAEPGTDGDGTFKVKAVITANSLNYTVYFTVTVEDTPDPA